MEEILPRIQHIANRITENENKRFRLSKFLRNVSAEAELKSRVSPDTLSGVKVAAVDGGLVKKSLHAFDCVLVRSAGVCFHYAHGTISKVEYHPSKMPPSVPEIFESLSDTDLTSFSHILRMHSEVETSIASIERFRPDMLLFDGPLVPHYTIRPAKTSPLYANYKKLIGSVRKLFETSRNRNTLLAGVIEDSRSFVFCEHIRKSILSKISHPSIAEISMLLAKTRDTNLLYLMLDRGEMSSVLRCGEDSPVTKELKEASQLYTFYLKASSHDRPVKVDFLGKGNAERIASILLPISGHHPSYGFPAPLIEADNVAKLGEEDMELFYSQILARVGNIPSIMRLRREERPF